MEITIDAVQFFDRLARIQSNWLANKSGTWGGSDALCVPYGAGSDDLLYSKSSSFHIYLLGYEFPDSIILVTKGDFYFMSNPKKCNYLKEALDGKGPTNFHFFPKTKDEGANRESMHNLINAVRKNSGSKIGSLFKDNFQGPFIETWSRMVTDSQLEKVEISPALSLLFAIKDDTEIELCKRAAVLSNKVMKHGFVTQMETILDKDSKVPHADISSKVESIISDPNQIQLKISADVVESCYEPIVQSGGKYDIRASAISNKDCLSSDVVICSLGARYKSYCANVSRTFMVDAPPKVEKTYATLLKTFNRCLEAMVVGNDLKDVYEAARAFLSKNEPSLLPHLPKSLGFALGIEFRDNNLVLNSNSTAKFAENMVFNLVVGFHNVPLGEDDKKGVNSDAVQKLSVYSMLLADTVRLQREGVPEILTKFTKEYADVSYNLSTPQEEDEDGAGEAGEAGEGAGGGDGLGGRRSSRFIESADSAVTGTDRLSKQKEILEKRIAEGRKRAANGGVGIDDTEEKEQLVAKDPQTYKGPSDYPLDVVRNPNQVRVDMTAEALFIPINGQIVPFHISTIKSVVLPGDIKNVSYLRVNFYTSGAALGKEVAKNMQLLVERYGPTLPFIKEITLRSLNPRHFTNVHTQFQELRKRVRQREQRVEQEKDLVVQAKLIRIKDQRIPRLQDVTVRPQLSGKKCIGTLEAHQNGMRFSSSKGEVLDILYVNVKHAIYQPCDKTTMVLLHFHLKDHIMIGKKKQKDVQFFTEIVESSLNLDGARRGYSHDADELDEEQREREMRRRLNLAFKEFSIKLEKIAAHYSFQMQIDAPYKKFSFMGNPNREMVTIQPTANCIVNLSEQPPFLVTLSEVEHVHFERVLFGGKNFDMTFIFKNWEIKPRTISSVDTKSKELIQDWLNLIEISWTVGNSSINWAQTMEFVKQEADVFYEETDEFGEKRLVGWTFLSADDILEDEEDEEQESDSEFNSDEAEESSEEDDDDSDESFDDEDEDESGDEDDDDDDEDEEDDEEVEREQRAKERAAAANKRPAPQQQQKSSSSSSFNSSNKKPRN